ncbi:MAG: c-type cytochrome [Gemmatimonadaceae bacterium]|nr:c-type cytochrome [Gemmatimonadaceae bacterium]
MHSRLRTLVAAAAGLLMTPSAFAQGDSTLAPAGRSAMSGVMNAEQVARGRATHRTSCGSCHGAEAYTGESFEQAWKGRTVFDLYELIKTTMPEDNPGQLPVKDYVDIVAYILNLNGYPQGDAELSVDEAELKLIRIDSIPPRP